MSTIFVMNWNPYFIIKYNMNHNINIDKNITDDNDSIDIRMNSLYSFSNELCPLLNRAHYDFKLLINFME